MLNCFGSTIILLCDNHSVITLSIFDLKGASLTIRAHPKVDTTGWGDKVAMNRAPDWSGVTPEDIAGHGRRWPQDPADRPWFDSENAERELARRHAEGLVSGIEASLLKQWLRDGYFVLENAIEPDHAGLLDQYANDLDAVWTANEEIPGLQLMSVRVDGVKREPMDHAELLSMPLEQRLALRDSQSWRIHYFQAFTNAGLQLASSNRLMRMANLLLDRDPTLLNLTAYKYSSVSGAHQDVLFYHLHPPRYFVGIWLACEDVSPETGPLEVYPGSHSVPPWPGFENYPQTNYRTAHPDAHKAQFQYVRDAVAQTPPITLPVRKGDAIFTHGLLVHGARDVDVRGPKSRFSMVLHYSVPGANRIDEIEGSFNY